MKKITNKVLLLLLPLALFSGCGNKEEKKATLKPEEIVAQAKEIVAIGKVLPEGGIIAISAKEAAVVEQILVKEGDSVKKDEVLVQLRSTDETLDVAEAKARLDARRAENAAAVYDLKTAETQLAESQKRYQTSRELAEKGAETSEVLLADRSAFIQQQQKVAQARQVIAANAKSLQELRQSLKRSQQSLGDRQIKAPEAGVVLSLDVNPGETLEPNIAFAELAPAGKLLIECEVDELYASKVRLGQKVRILPTRGASAAAEGVVSYVGASLQDKSILYETVGEGTDRRVRRVKVEIGRKDRELLINDKVECRILMQ